MIDLLKFDQRTKELSLILAANTLLRVNYDNLGFSAEDASARKPNLNLDVFVKVKMKPESAVCTADSAIKRL
jgi:hypothetical protein